MDDYTNHFLIIFITYMLRIILQGDGAALIDTVEAGILDLYLTKQWALKYAVGAACTVLKVDQIIMAKRAGGPKVPSGAGGVRDEDE